MKIVRRNQAGHFPSNSGGVAMSDVPHAPMWVANPRHRLRKSASRSASTSSYIAVRRSLPKHQRIAGTSASRRSRKPGRNHRSMVMSIANRAIGAHLVDTCCQAAALPMRAPVSDSTSARTRSGWLKPPPEDHTANRYAQITAARIPNIEQRAYVAPNRQRNMVA